MIIYFTQDLIMYDRICSQYFDFFIFKFYDLSTCPFYCLFTYKVIVRNRPGLH